MARFVFISGLVAASAAAPVRAGDWTLAAQAQLAGGYDDNTRLSSTNSTAAWTGIGDAGAELQFRDDTFLWQLQPRLRMVRYDDDRTLNRTEQYLTMTQQLTGQRGVSSLALNGTFDTTLTSELGLTGLAEVNKEHRSGGATLSNSYQISERWQSELQIQASVHRYIDAQFTGLVDYDYGSAAVSTGYSLTERSTISLQGSAGRLEVPDAASLNKNNYSATLGYATQLSPRWRFKMSAGPSKISTQRRTDTGSIYDAQLSYTSELTTIAFDASRSITPTGRGLLTRHEQLRVALDTSFTPRWSASLSLATIRNRDFLPSGALELSAVTYSDASGGLTWRTSHTWSIALTAGYTQQRAGTNQPTAERRHVGLNVSWNGLARRLN